MSDWISLELRNFVRQRARGRCEYCQLHEDDAGLRQQPDHIVALKHRGATVESNLARSLADQARKSPLAAFPSDSQD